MIVVCGDLEKTLDQIWYRLQREVQERYENSISQIDLDTESVRALDGFVGMLKFARENESGRVVDFLDLAKLVIAAEKVDTIIGEAKDCTSQEAIHYLKDSLEATPERTDDFFRQVRVMSIGLLRLAKKLDIKVG